MDSLHLGVYSDAPFASNDDNGSQLVYLILLADDSNCCHILALSSKKSKRVIRFIMEGEFFVLSTAIYYALVIQQGLKSILGQSIKQMIFMGLKQLFDVIKKSSYTIEKRLMIEVTTAREAYNRYEISNEALVIGLNNPSE